MWPLITLIFKILCYGFGIYLIMGLMGLCLFYILSLSPGRGYTEDELKEMEEQERIRKLHPLCHK